MAALVIGLPVIVIVEQAKLVELVKKNVQKIPGD